MAQKDNQLLMKNYLKYVYFGDANNTIIENYNNFKDTSLKDTPESLEIIINDKDFINELINSYDLEEVKEEVEEWEQYYYPWRYKQTN